MTGLEKFHMLIKLIKMGWA